MIRIELPTAQRRILPARRIRTANLAERCWAVLLSDRGQRVLTIAETMGRHEHTIRSWLKAYLKDGVEGLKAAPPVGRTHRKEQAALTRLQPVWAHHPSDDGDLEAGWSTNLLVDYLHGQGLEASASTVKRALKRGGRVSQCFAKALPAHTAEFRGKKSGWTRWSAPSNRSRATRT